MLHLLFSGIRLQIASALEFLLDLLQFLVGRGPVQLFQHASQVGMLFLTQLDLPGQLFLRILHTGVVLVELRRILVGGQKRRNGNVDFLHFLIVEILCPQNSLALGDSVHIGSDNIAQLAEPLPVIGGLQLFFLDSQLSGQAGAKVGHGLSHRLALLAHGIPAFPLGIEIIQQRAEGIRSLVAAILADGAEGELLGSAVRLGGIARGGVEQVLPEPQMQLVRHIVNIQPFHPGIHASRGKQCCLPADHGGQAAQAIHQPVGEDICSLFT